MTVVSCQLCLAPVKLKACECDCILHYRFLTARMYPKDALSAPEAIPEAAGLGVNVEKNQALSFRMEE